MSRFVCKCGLVTRESEERSGASGMLLSLSDAEALEHRIATIVASFLSVPAEQRGAWIESQFGAAYPKDLEVRELIEDIVAQVVIDAPFSSTFSCPSCGRLALADPPERAVWRWFTLD